jgi:hypothetical protein
MLTDTKARAAKPKGKPYKLTDTRGQGTRAKGAT